MEESISEFDDMIIKISRAERKRIKNNTTEYPRMVTL
jgi:hypothetical protein